MPRRRVPNKRKILPDPKFQDRLVAKFINDLMRKGKKSTAEHIAYGAFAVVEERAKEEPLKVFKRALDNVKPVLEVKSRRVGGATYQVPMEVGGRRAGTLAIRWLVGFSRDRRERTMAERLANELLDASNGIGAAMKRKEDLHKMAESNKAFAHYRW